MFLQHQPVQQHHTSLSAHHATPRWADHRWQRSEAAATVCLSWVVMLGTISSLPATLKGHYGPLTWGFSHNAEKLEGAQGTLAPWTQMDSGPRWTCLAFVCLCLMQPPSPMMPSSLPRPPSVWMCLSRHSTRTGRCVVCSPGSGFRNLAGVWAWRDKWGYTVGLSQGAVKELCTCTPNLLK